MSSLFIYIFYDIIIKLLNFLSLIFKRKLLTEDFYVNFFNQHSIINNILNTLNYYQYYYSVLFCWNKEKQD